MSREHRTVTRTTINCGLVAGLLVGGVALAACGSSTAGTTTTTRAAAATGPLTIMVTNDDGVAAPGIDTVVQGLRTLPHTEVTVVAPATNQSGTGGKTTTGTLATSPATTASGYPATAVQGYPADTVIWAVSDHGLSFRPDLVVSGINFGQNIGPLASCRAPWGPPARPSPSASRHWPPARVPTTAPVRTSPPRCPWSSTG